MNESEPSCGKSGRFRCSVVLERYAPRCMILNFTLMKYFNFMSHVPRFSSKGDPVEGENCS